MNMKDLVYNIQSSVSILIFSSKDEENVKNQACDI